MTKRVTLLVIILLTTTNLYSQWECVHPEPSGTRFRWCKMWDSNTYYMAGESGIFIKTTDRGQTWFVNSNAGFHSSDFTRSGDIWDGHFFNMNTGIIVGQGGGMRTTNGGLNFVSIPDLASSGVKYKIHFWNSQNGYVCGASNFLKFTSDGGITWNSITTGLSNAYYSLAYIISDSIFCLGSNQGNIVRSTNGGANWSVINTGAGNSFLYASELLNKDSGFVAGNLNAVRFTSNGGSTWVNRNPSFASGTTWFDIDIIESGGNHTIYLTGSYKYLLKSTDYGLSWDTTGIYPHNSISFDQLNNTDILNGDTILTVGNSRILSKWGPQEGKELIKSTKLGTLSFNDNNGIWGSPGSGKIWVSGNPSVANTTFDQMMFSSDYGNNWILQNTENSGAALYDIFMLSDLTGYVVGDSGTVLKTINGGNNWNKVNNPTNLHLRSLFFVNENTGWVLGRDTALFKTTNGGMNWVFQKVPNMANIASSFRCKIFMVNQNTGWVSGRGIDPNIQGIWKTTDGGANWSNQNAGIGSVIIPDIKMLNENTGYLCGLGLLRKTTDGGTNWDIIPSPSSTQYLSIDLLDDPNKFIVTSFESTIFTTNGGESWIVSKGNNGGNNSRIKMLSDTLFFVTGNYFSVFKLGDILTGEITQWFNETPTGISLNQNYPNPFNPTTNIEFAIPRQGRVSLKIYDIAGREVKTLIDGLELNAGTVKQTFDGSSLASGLYFYSLIVDDMIVGTKKMVLLK